jgi:hypothetical protein
VNGPFTTATLEGLTIVTSDQQFGLYEVPVIGARH